MLPFGRIFAVLRAYGTAIWPTKTPAFALGAIAVCLISPWCPADTLVDAPQAFDDFVADCPAGIGTGRRGMS
jgi:hypothetical protein